MSSFMLFFQFAQVIVHYLLILQDAILSHIVFHDGNVLNKIVIMFHQN